MRGKRPEHAIAKGTTVATRKDKSENGRVPGPREITPLRLSNLLLDEDNPRFGMQNRGSSQQLLLDHIVEKFGVDDC